MITVGIDSGLKYTKIAIVRDGKMIANGIAETGGKGRGDVAKELLADALIKAGISINDISCIISTGGGRFDVADATDSVIEEIADVRFAKSVFADVKAVVDIGADQTRVITLDENGVISDFVRNQKCMAGLGLMLDYIGRRLHFTMDEMSEFGPKEARDAITNDGCPVFAEGDALELLRIGVPREQVAGAVTESAVVRLKSILFDRAPIDNEKTIVMGGVALNGAVMDALSVRCGVRFIIPEAPEYGGAIGAALIAADKVAV